MDSRTYNAAVLGTESKPQTINFGTIGTHAMLGLIYQTGEMVDVAKKAMFYGKAFDRFKFAEDAATLADLAMTIRQSALDGDLNNPQDIKAFTDLPPHIAGLDLNNSLNKRLLHVVFGTSSESSEIANELRLAWEEKRPVDRVNMSEEIGDHLWYLAVGADELNVPLSVIFEQNITKLNDKKTGRYQEGAFSIDGAINRNLEAERANLASSLVNTAAPGVKIPVVYGGAAEYRNRMVGTSSSQIYYSPDHEQFVVFDEAALEHSRHDSFNQAVAEQNRYADQLNGTHCAGHCDHSPASAIPSRVYQVQGANAGEMSVAQAEQVAANPAGGTLERFGAAAKTYAGKALDAVDAGVDKAKDLLNRQ
jgi:hypothetical protein